MLKSRWDQTCEGMGQIVLLIGDEGMGKTRLVRELVSHAADSSAGSGARQQVLPEQSSGTADRFSRDKACTRSCTG
jgi:predicted ATPase